MFWVTKKGGRGRVESDNYRLCTQRRRVISHEIKRNSSHIDLCMVTGCCGASPGDRDRCGRARRVLLQRLAARDMDAEFPRPRRVRPWG